MLFCAFFAQLTGAASQASDLVVRWSVEASGERKNLKTWTPSELSAIKGSLMSTVLEKSMESLTPEGRARVDLVIVTSGTGVQAWIPRSLITRYPLVLNARGELRVPWKSHPKILSEPLPIQSFELSGVESLDFANYQDRFGAALLKRRTDPTAMRGEKLFLQNCRACHESRQSPTGREHRIRLGDEPVIRELVEVRHRAVNGMPKFSRKEIRALKVYWEAIQAESPAPATASAEGTATIINDDRRGSRP